MRGARAGVMAVIVAACGGGGSGVDAPVGLPDAPAGEMAATADELVDACVKYLGCLEAAGTVSGCIENGAEQDPVDVRCMAAATTCDGVLGCLSMTRTEGTCANEDCSASGSSVTCLPGARLEQDCAARGQSCTMGIDGSYCQDECEIESCSGDVLDRCDDNPDLDCGRLGWSCDPGGPRCSDGTAFLCASEDHCDGAELVECVFGYEMRLDCDRLVAGTTCRTVGGVGFCGTGTACGVSAPGAETCSGTGLLFCARGELVTRDCTAYGAMFTACTSGLCRP